MLTVIETRRLLLREWRDADREPFAALNADPEVMRHFPATMSREETDVMVDRLAIGWQQRGYGLWAVERRDTGEFIGFIGLSSPSWQTSFTPCVEVGWRLAAAHWGQGFAPEGARAALTFAFQHLELPNDEVVSFTTTGNANSRRVMAKIGMVHDPDDDFDHPMLPDWPEKRHVLYRIDRRSWEAGVAR